MNPPRTFRTSLGSYALLCGVLSVPLLLLAGGALAGGHVERTALLLSAVPPAAAALWLAGFKLRIDDSGIEYRSLLGGSFRIPYSEIDSLRTHTIRTSRGLYRQWVLQLRDGRSLPMNLKPFVSSAYSVLLQRIRGGA